MTTACAQKGTWGSMNVLETPRLILRPLRPDDLDVLYSILSDPITMSFWPAPFSGEQVQAWIERAIAHEHEHGFGRRAVVLKTSGELIGDCGLRRAELDGAIENDLGYILFRDHWRRGYAAEAAAACLAHGFGALRLDRICANMPADHLASRRVAERIGMRLEKQYHNRRNRGILTCLYASTRTTG
ncbi:MAG TPA: GNAT family N-acetyltransferase [Roseiflexaceae bacterium]